MRKAIFLLYFTFLINVLIKAENSEENEVCEEVHVNNKIHKKHILGLGLNRPYQLAYDHIEHKVFFSYNIGDDKEDLFEIGYIEKGHVKHKVMKGVENGFAIAADNKDKVIYFGGSKGIYKHHLNKNSTDVEKIIHNRDVWDMFFKHHLYFIEYPSQHLYKVEYEKSKIKIERQKHIHEKIYQFAIDGDDDIFITTESGLHMIKNGTEHRIFYEGPKVFRAIEINNKGEAYFSGQSNIFVANKKNDTLHQIAHIKNVFGLAFDNDDNIIYSTPAEIVKLLPEECKNN